MYVDLAILLEYPGAGLGRALDACVRQAKSPEAAGAIEAFRSASRELKPGELEELYTRTFDLQPETCLYIGHHLFGEDWRRGMFMSRLQHRYGERGFSPGTESPDYLPVVLRFLASEPGGPEMDELLQDCVIPAAARLHRTLEKNSNPYAAVLRAALLWIGTEGQPNFGNEDLTCRPLSSSLFPILP